MRRRFSLAETSRQRLKGTLRQWLVDLLRGPYDAQYVARRSRVRLAARGDRARSGLHQCCRVTPAKRATPGTETVLQDRVAEGLAVRRSLNTLLDLDLAIIEDAYQAEYTARHQRAEKERGEAAFRTLVEAAPGMIVILRPAARVAYVSPFAEVLTGHRGSELQGHDFAATLLPESQRKAWREEIARVFAGTPCRNYESAVLTADGSQRWVVWNAQRLDDYEGSRRCWPSARTSPA